MLINSFSVNSHRCVTCWAPFNGRGETFRAFSLLRSINLFRNTIRASQNPLGSRVVFCSSTQLAEESTTRCASFKITRRNLVEFLIRSMNGSVRRILLTHLLSSLSLHYGIVKFWDLLSSLFLFNKIFFFIKFFFLSSHILTFLCFGSLRIPKLKLFNLTERDWSEVEQRRAHFFFALCLPKLSLFGDITQEIGLNRMKSSRDFIWTTKLNWIFKIEMPQDVVGRGCLHDEVFLWKKVVELSQKLKIFIQPLHSMLISRKVLASYMFVVPLE